MRLLLTLPTLGAFLKPNPKHKNTENRTQNKQKKSPSQLHVHASCTLCCICCKLAHFSICETMPGRCSPYDISGIAPAGYPGFSSAAYFGSRLSIVGCFWSWWRTQLPPQHHPNIRPYCRARKYLGSAAQWVNVPEESLLPLLSFPLRVPCNLSMAAMPCQG